jgi:hypothetical protein
MKFWRKQDDKFQKYYQTGKMQDRVRKTLEKYKVQTSYHIDVLTSEPRRYDYDPLSPSAAEESIQYKKALIHEFNKHGLSVTSETLTRPFVGAIGYFWYTRQNSNLLFKGEKQIPLIPMIYHGLVTYGGCELPAPECNVIAAKAGIQSQGWEANYIDLFYTQILPTGLLSDQTMEDYEEQGNTSRTSFSNNGHIIVDKKTGNAEICVNGRVIAKNGQIFAPGFRNGEYLAYSNTGSCEFDLPENWNAEDSIEGTIFTEDGNGDSAVITVDRGKIRIEMQANTPVLIKKL